MINWSDLEALADDLVLGTFSERFNFLPYTKTPNGDSLKRDYPRNAVQQLRAVLYWPNETAAVPVGSGSHIKVEIESARIVINRRDYPELEIRRGDLLQALDREVLLVLKAGKVVTDNRRIIVLDVSEERIPYEARNQMG